MTTTTRNEAAERLHAFLEHWPMGSLSSDEIYRIYVHGEEHLLSKSDILEALAVERRAAVERLSEKLFLATRMNDHTIGVALVQKWLDEEGQ